MVNVKNVLGRIVNAEKESGTMLDEILVLYFCSCAVLHLIKIPTRPRTIFSITSKSCTDNYWHQTKKMFVQFCLNLLYAESSETANRAFGYAWQG